MNRKKDEFIRYVVLLSHIPGKSMSEKLVRDHVSHLKMLDEKGQLVLCGPFSDFEGGMVVIKAASYDEAKDIAENDPFVKEGVENYELRTLELSCKENNHMGMG
ncbi:MAG: YciI-like protein [Candidatus Scalindua rubra]|uniref:YciI-like protein n=1 Tax=Candidatus Scalindua rubra TaxID=1872076 RepID=A0A1E3X534_9BACT|nr:MAG: YciI-like protein [Candidatus Scalindua rubra]